MPNELLTPTTPGLTLYALLFNHAGQIYDGSSFVTPSAAGWEDYAIPAIEEDSTGIYYADMPAVSAGVYPFTFRRQTGASPVPADPTVAVGSINWDGTAEVPYPSIPAGDAYSTLATLRSAIRLQLADSDTWPDPALDGYIADAIRAYSNEFPREEGYPIPVEDNDVVPVVTSHWEALVAFVDFRAHWQLSAGEAADMNANSIALSQLNTAGRMAWNRYKEIIDRITWHHRGQSAAVTWNLPGVDASPSTGRIY